MGRAWTFGALGEFHYFVHAGTGPSWLPPRPFAGMPRENYLGRIHVSGQQHVQ